MARLIVNDLANVLTGKDSKAYQPMNGSAPEVQITIPRFHARLSIDEADAIAKMIAEAVAVARALPK